jgi:hypothetical protein
LCTSSYVGASSSGGGITSIASTKTVSVPEPLNFRRASAYPAAAQHRLAKIASTPLRKKLFASACPMPTSLNSRSKCLSVSRSSAIAPDSSRGKNSDPKKSSSALNAAITSHAIGNSISSETGNITRCGQCPCAPPGLPGFSHGVARHHAVSRRLMNTCTADAPISPSPSSQPTALAIPKSPCSNALLIEVHHHRQPPVLRAQAR